MTWTVRDLATLLEEAGCLVVASDEYGVQLQLSGTDAERPHATRASVASSAAGRLVTLEVTYPFSAPVPDDARLAGALLAPYLSLGRFDVDDTGGVRYRYAMVVAPDVLPREVLGQTIALVNYEQVHFGDYLEAVCVLGSRLDTFPRLVAAGEASGID